MKILRRSILLEITGSFGLGTLVFSAVLLTNEVSSRLMETLVQENITLKEAGLLFLCILPKILTFSIPMSVLLGILICFGRLSADSEITAMRSSGIGLRNLLWPVLVFSAVVGTVALLNSNLWSPRATHRLSAIKDEVALKSLNTVVRRGVFEERFPGRVVYVMDTAPDQRSWKGIFLAEVTEANWPKTTFSRQGGLLNHLGRRELQLNLQQGATYEVVPGKDGTVRVTSFEEATVPLFTAMGAPADEPKDKTIAEMDTIELYGKVISDTSTGGDLYRNKAVIELNRRLALPLAVFVFSILGLPLGVVTRRGRQVVRVRDKPDHLPGLFHPLFTGSGLCRKRPYPGLPGALVGEPGLSGIGAVSPVDLGEAVFLGEAVSPSGQRALELSP